MWLYYLFLAVGATKTVLGQDSQISIAGTGTISKNGKTSLNIQVEIGGQPAAGKTGYGGYGGYGGGGGGEPFTQEEEIGLSVHNEFRQVHGVPGMTLDRQMCDQAKAWAERLAQRGQLQHSSSQEREGQGENLSYGCSSNQAQTMEEAVTGWYNEVCKPGYNFNSGGFSGGTGHFTQVVWKESTVLGIGRVETMKNGMKCAYIVGRYKPAGNMMGAFQQNVPRGNFDEGYCRSISNSGWKKKFLDAHGQAMAIDSPMSANATSAKTGRAEIRGQNLWILKNKKKATVARKRN
ncbi:uncharacterized protein LOC144649653 isoform X1 [Oculina patagonica]